MTNLVKGIVAVVLLVFFAACGNSAKNVEETSQNMKPNIIYILADDAGYGDLSC